MKRILTLLLLSGILFAGCQKSSVKPDSQVQGSQTSNGSTNLGQVKTGGAVIDSLSNINGFIRLQLAKDSINSDNVLINFKPGAKTKYVVNEDAPTFQGFGQVSLSSFSSDDIPLAINSVPLTKKGITIALKVNAKSDGIYKLLITQVKSLPAVYDIWLMDKYRKDSLDVRHNPAYAFNIFKSDTGTMGSQRFKLVIRVR